MKNIRRLLARWLPVVLWMALIFSASTDLGSSRHSSRLIGPILRFLFPRISDAVVDDVVLVVRKCGHVSEYGILTLLVWRARRTAASPWSWTTAAESLWVAVLYAATDEFHQTFVPSREGCVRDVGIDSSGAVVALVALWLATRARQRWRRPA